MARTRKQKSALANISYILEPKESFRYLGSVIHKSGRIEDDVTHHIQADWLKWRAATGILCDMNVPLKLKGKFYRVVIRLAMLYRSEFMTIVNKIRERRLRWLGHVKRRPQSTPHVRRVESITVDDVRRRGRPKLRWEDILKIDLKELLLSEDMIYDRKSHILPSRSFLHALLFCLLAPLLFCRHASMPARMVLSFYVCSFMLYASLFVYTHVVCFDALSLARGLSGSGLSTLGSDESNAMRNMMSKLRYLKGKIREWINDFRNKTKRAIGQYKEELQALDDAIDKGKGSDDIVNKRMEVLNSMQHFDKIQAMDIAQKAKIKWAIEGDENSRYYHGVLNKKRSQLSIRGIMVDGVWTEKPNSVKLKFLQHFRRRFEKPTGKRAYVDMNFPKSISIDQQMDLECDVSIEELKRAVWECGTDKSPGPDGFTFGFYRKFWTTIEKDVFAAVTHFFTYGDIPKGCNSSFIALIPKVRDANLVKDFRPICIIGTKVGGSMSRVQAWTEVIDKVKSRLSNWKMKALSIRGITVGHKGDIKPPFGTTIDWRFVHYDVPRIFMAFVIVA
ncbi:hypothetical protein Tco_0802019 [Tanacetum coccineum]|uniref:RNA-directed DNA polymerase, eukaryota, reverse transcriptase zinc-binding domain protein n=1 Tax=Tanacetum coccineum TaxID=301880 RepID=A0ABQ4ZZX4_9ASTR